MGGGEFGNIRPVKIGNDVFIGWGAIILAGTAIEDNVIIGAGAVVSGHVDKNSVYAGNPAKKIMTMEQYVKRLEARQESDLDKLISCYHERFGRMPSESVIGNYKNVIKNS